MLSPSTFPLPSLLNYYRQIRLMHGLTGDYWGTNEKLRRIAAAEHASLLPPKTATAVSIMSSNLRAGGLIPDEDGWVF